MLFTIYYYYYLISGKVLRPLKVPEKKITQIARYFLSSTIFVDFHFLPFVDLLKVVCLDLTSFWKFPFSHFSYFYIVSYMGFFPP